jgi:hypothetical protein
MRDLVPEFPAHTDDGAVREGFVSLTVLAPTGMAAATDLTPALAAL